MSRTGVAETEGENLETPRVDTRMREALLGGKKVTETLEIPGSTLRPGKLEKRDKETMERKTERERTVGENERKRKEIPRQQNWGKNGRWG